NLLPPELAELAEFFVVGDEFGIGAAAEFVEIQTLPFAFHGHALRTDSIQSEIEGIGHRQYETNECGNGYDLGKRLASVAGGSGLEESSTDGDNRNGEARENSHGK